MPKVDKCGIYEIRCVVSGKSYVGSSCRIGNRWRQHLYQLRKAIHRSPRLQQAWSKHGEANFVFSVLEECAREDLFTREQFHIDAKKRDYNSMPQVRVITREMLAKILAAGRLRAATRTHCPKGHEFTPENTYFGKRERGGDKRCRRCEADRQAVLRAADTPEMAAARKEQFKRIYQSNLEEKRAERRAYGAAHREQKRAYDKARRVISNEQRRARNAAKNSAAMIGAE